MATTVKTSVQFRSQFGKKTAVCRRFINTNTKTAFRVFTKKNVKTGNICLVFERYSTKNVNIAKYDGKITIFWLI